MDYSSLLGLLRPLLSSCAHRESFLRLQQLQPLAVRPCFSGAAPDNPLLQPRHRELGYRAQLWQSLVSSPGTLFPKWLFMSPEHGSCARRPLFCSPGEGLGTNWGVNHGWGSLGELRCDEQLYSGAVVGSQTSDISLVRKKGRDCTSGFPYLLFSTRPLGFNLPAVLSTSVP